MVSITKNMSKKKNQKKLSDEELRQELGTNENEGNLKEIFNSEQPLITGNPKLVPGTERTFIPDMSNKKEEPEEFVEIFTLELANATAQRGFVLIEEFNEQNIEHITERGIIIPKIIPSKLELKENPNLRYEGGYKAKIILIGPDVPKNYNVGDIIITFKPSPVTTIKIEGKTYNFISWQDIALTFSAKSLKKLSVNKKDAEAAGYFTDGTDVMQPNRTVDNEVIGQEDLTEKLLKESKEDTARRNLKKAGLVGIDGDPKIIKP